MTDTQSAGVAIREKALEYLDETTAASATRMVPNAETAFARFFGERLDGTYRPSDKHAREAVTFDLDDGLAVWYVREPRKGGNRKLPRDGTRWLLSAPCATKRCENPRLVAELRTLADLGRALDTLDDGLCPTCSRSAN